ncbi:hypothetical protein BDQ17DRAFT_1433517 [Cyathus striatus]|nr:hypothetical protein BDQ17DRAFT_1433517 [Cyathus striatus]
MSFALRLMPPQLSDEAIPISIDSYLSGVIVDAFTCGLYTFLLYRTIQAAAPRLRSGRHITLMIALVFLYILTMANLAATWVVVRSVVVTKGSTQTSTAAEMFFGSRMLAGGIAPGLTYAAMLIADSLLVWRCYIMWHKSKWLLTLFGVLLLGESAIIPIFLVLDPSYVFSKHVPETSFFSITLFITVVATAMIIYRILTISWGTETVGRYRYTIEILVESGILYSATVLITVIFQVLPNSSLPFIQAATYFSAILIPVTGIAPTLISHRVFTSTESDEERWSQPISSLRFNHTIQRDETNYDSPS